MFCRACESPAAVYYIENGQPNRSAKMKWNESGFRPPSCTYRLNWARRTSEDGEMIEMTLPSRHRIRNSSPGGLRPSTLPLGHRGPPQYWLSHVDGEETCFVSFKPPRPGTEPRSLSWKAAVLTTTLGPPPKPKCNGKASHLRNRLRHHCVAFTRYVCMITVAITGTSRVRANKIWFITAIENPVVFVN